MCEAIAEGAPISIECAASQPTIQRVGGELVIASGHQRTWGIAAGYRDAAGRIFPVGFDAKTSPAVPAWTRYRILGMSRMLIGRRRRRPVFSLEQHTPWPFFSRISSDRADYRLHSDRCAAFRLRRYSGRGRVAPRSSFALHSFWRALICKTVRCSLSRTRSCH